MKERYTDLMLYIETIGINPGVGIIQIAAVPFNVNTGKVSKNTFSKAINMQHQIDNGFNFNVSTLKWWRRTNNELFKTLSESSLTYNIVGKEFQSYFKTLDNHKDIRVWGNSARFDIGIVQGWYRRAIGYDFQPFWNTWKEMDVRTISTLKPDIKASTKFIGEKHNALDDCRHQIRYTSAIINELGITIR